MSNDERQPTLNVWVSTALRARLDEAAKARATSVGRVVRSAVLEFLRKEASQ